DDPAIGGARRGVVVLVRVFRGAAHLGGAVDAIERQANDAAAVDRIVGCWLVELHVRSSRNTDATVRVSSVFLKALDGVVFAPASAASATACGPCAAAASAAGTRQG